MTSKLNLIISNDSVSKGILKSLELILRSFGDYKSDGRNQLSIKKNYKIHITKDKKKVQAEVGSNRISVLLHSCWLWHTIVQG